MNLLKVRVLMRLTIALCGVFRLHGADNSPLSREALEETIHQYILNHPEVVADAMTRFQVLQQKAQIERTNKAIQSHESELYHDSSSPAAGGDHNPIVIVEFFDYRCSFCKRADSIVMKLTDNPNVRVIFKEFPILSAESLTASQAALAAGIQGAYLKYHRRVMDEASPLTRDKLLDIAAQLGLNVKKFDQDMSSPEVSAAIERTRRRARATEAASSA